LKEAFFVQHSPGVVKLKLNKFDTTERLKPGLRVPAVSRCPGKCDIKKNKPVCFPFITFQEYVTTAKAFDVAVCGFKILVVLKRDMKAWMWNGAGLSFAQPEIKDFIIKPNTTNTTFIYN